MSVAFSATNLLFAFLGIAIGAVVGVLPGAGAVAAIALLIPALAGVDAIPAVILLAGVCYAAQQGSARTAVYGGAANGLASGWMVLDGLQVARQGRAGAGLAIAAVSACAAGCIGAALIAALAAPFGRIAFEFGPAEYFALLVLGLVGAVVLAAGSLVKSLATLVLGLLLAQIGGAGDAAGRFTLGVVALAGGVPFVIVALGVFVVAPMVVQVALRSPQAPAWPPIEALRPTRRDLDEAWPSLLRGTALGAAIGLLPGGSSRLAAWLAYALEHRVVGAPRVAFGKGAIEGIAGPEAARSASAQTSFLPLLAFGVPANAAMALLIGALMLHGVAPGPQVMTASPALFWGLIASMWVGNLMLVLLQLPLARLGARLAAVPYRLVFPVVLVLACIAAAAFGKSAVHVVAVAAFAALGVLLRQLACEAAPLLLGFVLTPMLEANARHALALSAGAWSTFVTRPLSSALLLAAALLVAAAALPAVRRRRDAALREG